MNSVKKYSLIFFAFILATTVFFYYGTCKAGFFIDEIHTYGLSNSHYAPYITDAVGGTLVDNEITREELIDYATVGSGENLDFGSVYYNQTRDVHPPLYYFIFNAASSLAGENFSKWTGLVLGYVIYLFVLFVLALLCRNLFGNRTVTAAVLILYGISTIGISTAIYIRMYVLLTFFTVLLAYFAEKLITEGRQKFCPVIGLVIFLGLLTQYYFVFYAFFLCISICIFLVFGKQWKLLLVFMLCAMAGAGIMPLVFSAAFKQIFVGNGVVVGGNNITKQLFDTSAYALRIYQYARFIGHGLKAALVTGICAGAADVFLLISKRTYLDKKTGKVLVLLVLPAILSWVVCAVISPIVEERYIYNIMPLFVLITGYALHILICSFKNKKIEKSLLTALLTAAIALLFAFRCRPEYLFPEYENYNAMLEPHRDCPAVYLTDNRFEPLTYDFQQLLIFNTVFTTDNASSEKMAEYVSSYGCDEAILFVDINAFWSSGYDPKVKVPEVCSTAGFSESSELYSNGFSAVYLLSR